MRDYISATNRLGKFLGRTALLADLTPPNYTAFVAWLREHYTTGSVQDTHNRLRTIWRAAIQARFVTVPVPRKARPFDATPKWETEVPVEASVRWFYLSDYFPMRIRSRSPHTHRLYQRTIRGFGQFLGREPMLSDFTDRTLADYLHSLVERGLSPHTICKEFDQLAALWRGACRRNLVREWPTMPRPQAPDSTPKAWLRSDLDKLFTGLETVPGKICGMPAADWWLALHWVLFFTGERISAILELRWSDVDLQSSWLIVPAAARKGRKRDKATRLPPEAIEALGRIVEPKRPLVFPWQGDRGGLWIKYGKLLGSLGMPNDRRSKFHRMRRSTASHAEAASPGIATALLDHSSRKVTEKYIDPRIAQPPQAADLLFTPGKIGGAN